jgi:hypothetical protein
MPGISGQPFMTYPEDARMRGYIVLIGALILFPVVNAAGITWEANGQMQVGQPAVFYSSVSIQDADQTHSADLWVSTSLVTPHLYVSTTGLVGIGTSSPGTRLDVVATGKTAADYAQIWRNSAGTIVASMSATGVMSALSSEAMSNTVAFFNLSSCPPGWTDMTGTWGGLYVVGLPQGQTPGDIIGTALSAQENRPCGQHTHSVTENNHTHTGGGSTVSGDGGDVFLGYLDNQGMSGTSGPNSAYVSVDNTGPAGTNAPYVQLLICVKD